MLISKKIYKIFIFSFLILLLQFSVSNGGWMGSIENFDGHGNYEEKLVELKDIYDEGGIVSTDKIKKNRHDLKMIVSKGQLIGGKTLSNAIDVISINSLYEIDGESLNSVSITGQVPVFLKTGSSGDKFKYISLSPKKAEGILIEGKEEVWKNNILDIFGLKDEKFNGSMFPKFVNKGSFGYLIINKSNAYSNKKFWNLLDDETIGKNSIPIELENNLIMISLATEGNGMKRFNENKSEEDKLANDNPFSIKGKTQIDGFLFNYCMKEFFGGNHDKTFEMFKNGEYYQCGLLENDFNGDGINEIILVDYKYKVSNIYYQNKDNSQLIVGSIFKSNKNIFKILKNDNGVYSSFLLKDWYDSSSQKNILFNYLDKVEKGISEENYSSIDLSQKFKKSGNSGEAYSIKSVFSKGNLGHSTYKINGFYTIENQLKNNITKKGLDGGLILDTVSKNKVKLVLNERFVGLIGKNNNFLISRKDLGINFKDSFIELSRQVKGNNYIVSLVVDGKTKFILGDGNEAHYNASIKGTIQGLIDEMDNVNGVGLLGPNLKGNREISVYDLKFLINSPGNIYLYGIQNDSESSFFQLKQILSLGGFDYNFTPRNNVNDRDSKNIFLINGENFEDGFADPNGSIKRNSFFFPSENVGGGEEKVYVGIDLFLRSVKYFSKDSLYIEQIKNIYFDYDKKNEVYYISNDKSNEEINVKGIKLGDYDFLDGCSYSEIINNDLENCAKNLTPIDVDGDKWNEWLFNNLDEVKIFNNIVKSNIDGTYQSSFIPIFKDSGLSYCNSFLQEIPYYSDKGTVCGEKESGKSQCKTNFGLIFYDDVGLYKTFVIGGKSQYDKSYQISDTSIDSSMVCII